MNNNNHHHHHYHHNNNNKYNNKNKQNIKPATLNNEIKLFEKYLSTGEPYQNLQLNITSTKNQIEDKYKELSRKYINGRKEKEAIYNSYKILSNDRLRELYDAYLYNTFDWDQDGNLEFDLNNVPIVDSPFMDSLSMLALILLGPVDKVSLIVNSSKSNISVIKVANRLLRESLVGLYRGTLFQMGYGLLFSFIHDPIKRLIKSTKSKSNVLYHILDSLVFGILKQPSSLISDLIQMAPVSLSVLDIITKVILRKENQDQSYQWKNLFYYGTSGLVLCCIKLNIKKLLQYFKSYSNNNSKDNRLFRYSSHLMNNIYSYSAILAICQLPFEIITAQYPRIFLESYYQSSPSSSLMQSINPISIAISVYKSNHNNIFSKLFNGFIPIYFIYLFDSLSEKYEDEFSQ